MKPIVSAIIPTYNNAKYICEAIDSVISQTYPNIEIIVVDDGSTDNTKEALLPYVSKIKYIYQKNAGVSVARNIGIKSATGNYVAFLDSDDIWLPNKIELQVIEISKSAICGLVSCGSYFCDEKLNIISQVIPSSFSSRRAFMRGMAFHNIVGGGSVALMRKKCFDKVGFFDNKLTASEDWDMWLRVAIYYEISIIRSPLIKRRDVQSSMSAAINADKMLKNEVTVLHKAFSHIAYRFDFMLKAKAYSYRYFHAAIAYRALGQADKMRKCIFIAILIFPPAIFLKSYISLFLRALLGRD